MKLNSVFIKFKISKPDSVFMKVNASGSAWKEVIMSLKDIQSPNFIKKLKRQTTLAEIPPNSYLDIACPSCGTIRGTWLRNYSGKYYFCGFCGAHLKFDPKNREVTLIAER